MAVLPRSDDAIVERTKLEEYVLDPTHEDGKHKARLFRTLLKIEQEDWRYLARELKRGLRAANEAKFTPRPYGYIAVVHMEIEGPTGLRRIVKTVWEGRNVDNRPRLITAYMEPKKLD